MGFLIPAIDKELGVEALADEAALHVHHRCHNGIDGSGFDFRLQFIECQHSNGHGSLPDYFTAS